MSSLSRNVVWLVGGLVGVGTLGCTSLLGTFDAEGAGGGASASGQGGAGMSSAGQGGATVSSSGEGGASSSTSSQGGASNASSGQGGGAVTSTGSSMGCVDCSPNADCVSDTCVCKPGFEGTGMTCTDIDECMGNPCGQNASCMNTVGSFNCLCLPGFTKIGASCEPIWVEAFSMSEDLAWNNWSMAAGGPKELFFGGVHSTKPSFRYFEPVSVTLKSGPSIMPTLFTASGSRPALAATELGVNFAIGDTGHYWGVGSNQWKEVTGWQQRTPIRNDSGVATEKDLLVVVGGTDKGGFPLPELVGIDVPNLNFLPVQLFPPYLHGPIAWPGATITNGELYVFGGTDGGFKPTNLGAKMDIGTEEWKELPKAPFEATRADLVATTSGLFYTDGTKVAKFDPGQSAWSNGVFSMPNNIVLARLVSVDDRVYAIGNVAAKLRIFVLANSPL